MWIYWSKKYIPSFLGSKYWYTFRSRVFGGEEGIQKFWLHCCLWGNFLGGWGGVFKGDGTKITCPLNKPQISS